MIFTIITIIVGLVFLLLILLCIVAKTCIVEDTYTHHIFKEYLKGNAEPLFHALAKGTFIADAFWDHPFKIVCYIIKNETMFAQLSKEQVLDFATLVLRIFPEQDNPYNEPLSDVLISYIENHWGKLSKKDKKQLKAIHGTDSQNDMSEKETE